MGNGVVPRISQVGLQVLQGTGAGVGYGLNDEPQKCDKCKTTVLDLLQLELLQVSTLRKAQGIERTTWILPLLRIRLAIPLRFHKGDGDELDSQNDGEVAPWHWVTKVSGLTTRGGCPFLGGDPVSIAKSFGNQHSRNGEHGPASVDELRLLESLQILRHFSQTQWVKAEVSESSSSMLTKEMQQSSGITRKTT